MEESFKMNPRPHSFNNPQGIYLQHLQLSFGLMYLKERPIKKYLLIA
jgi:hypothetical protein